MALDLKKVRNMDEKLKESNSLFLYPKDLNTGRDGLDFRVMPPVPELEGDFCFPIVQYFIGGKPYLCNSTFGKPSVIEEEVEIAKAEGDPDVLDLIENGKKFSQKKAWLTPILILDIDYKADGSFTDYKIDKDKVQVLAANKTITSGISRLAVSRKYLPDITDKEKGYNIILTKTGTGLDTEYFLEGWRDRMVLEDKYYEAKAIPNVYNMAKDLQKSDAYLRGVIRNYLYGEPMPKDEKKASSDTNTTSETAKGGSGRGTNTASNKTNPRGGSGRDKKEVDNEAEPEEKTNRTKVDKKTTKSVRDISQDIDDLG